MDTKDKFLQDWFSSVNDFLENGSKEEAEALLSRCAKKCSDSFSLGLYKTAFSDNTEIEKALGYLSEVFDDFNFVLLQDRIQISYQECGCGLYLEKLITVSQLCLCSEKSLKYNWESIFGQGNVHVKPIKSILKGDNICLFEIRVRQLGH